MFAPVFLFSGLHVAVQATPVDRTPPFFPLRYSYGGGVFSQVMVDVYFGSPPQPLVPVLLDAGAWAFWVDGPAATLNYGEDDDHTPGPCNWTVIPTYNYTASRTSTSPVLGYHGQEYMDGTVVESIFTVNDTMNFGPGVPALTNRRVAISEYTESHTADSNCANGTQPDQPHGVMGISSFKSMGSEEGDSPNFRQDLLEDGLIETSAMSIWFDEAPSDVYGTFRGTALFGALPSGKYVGELVKLSQSTDNGHYLVPMPLLRSASVSNAEEQFDMIPGDFGFNPDGVTRTCTFDTGAAYDSFPVEMQAFESAGLIEHDSLPAYDGPCSSIPADAAIHMTFPGSTAGKNVTIKVPLRNYARGGLFDHLDDGSKCALSLVLDSTRCGLGAPFASSVFLAVNDEFDELAIAQGGVSHGAMDGAEGLGEVKIVRKGQSLPGAV